MKTKTKKRLKIMMWIICPLFIIIIATMLICNKIVTDYAEGMVFSEIDSIAPTKWGLLLGTTPQTRIGNRQNMFFKYRIDAAEQLYKARKVQKYLISGDENSLGGVNEPQCMKDSLVARGVPADSIFLDGKGFRTLDSVVRTCKKYCIKSFIIISQRFHNERAVYLANHLGLDVERVQAYNAVSPDDGWAFITYAREYLARVKMFWDILTDKQPEELGKCEPLDEMRYVHRSVPDMPDVVHIDTLYSFFGHPLVFNGSISEQIADIAAHDKMLSYDGRVLQIGKVRWGVNPGESDIFLMTSVQPDAPQMKQVVKYLTGIYGKPYEDEDEGFDIKWSSSRDSLNVFKPHSTLVHLRSVHSENGGTTLIFH